MNKVKDVRKRIKSRVRNVYRNPESGKDKTIRFACLLTVVAAISVLFLIYSDSSQSKALWILIASLALSPGLIILLACFLGRIDYKNGIWDFIIGDEGTYSLSRLQAVVWALVIIALQMATVIALVRNPAISLASYDPVFSESSLWLLGLSLASTIAVKGIVVNNISKHPELYRFKQGPKLSDILTGTNGLDFSRCQMLLWFLIGIVVYIGKCYLFIEYIVNESTAENIEKVFNHFKEEYSSGTAGDLHKALPFVPFLPWAFIVLMGLGQGVYVGKKLVPVAKLDDVKALKQKQIQTNLTELGDKQKMLNSIVQMTKGNAQSANDKRNLEAIVEEINATEQQIVGLTRDINDIEQFKQQ